MKQILISIKPKLVAKILTGHKTLELRKTAPKELPCEVFIYCTKGDYIGYLPKRCAGKVLARFVLNRVDERHILPTERMLPFNKSVDGDLEKLCLTKEQVIEYGNGEDYYAKIWHISDLRIFNPKELSEFGVKRAPRSWCYVEML